MPHEGEKGRLPTHNNGAERDTDSPTEETQLQCLVFKCCNILYNSRQRLQEIPPTYTPTRN